MLVLQVFIMRNGAFEGTEMATGDRIEIGRDGSCAVRLEDESVSRHHAVIFEHDGKLAVQDLGSANGTRINGEPVGNGRFIGPRDDIAVGVFMLKVKVMSGSARAAPAPPAPNDGATRVYPAPNLGSSSSSQPRPNPASVAIGAAPNNERTAIAQPVPHQPKPDARALDAAATALSPPGLITGSSGENTVTSPSPPPVPPISEPDARPTRPVRAPESSRPLARPSPVPAMPDITSPDAPLPQAAQAARPSSPSPAALGQAPVSPSRTLPESLENIPGIADMELPAGPINTDGQPLPPLVWKPTFLAEELVEDDDEPPWSLVQQLVRPSSDTTKDPLLEIVHYRGELVVDHQVLHVGETFKLGDKMSRAERRDRGLSRAIPLVRLKQGGVAEVFQREEVAGRLLRGNQQIELTPGKGAVPITDGELASLRVGNERVFIRFAGSPKLMWTREDAAEDRFNRRLNGIAAGSSVGLFLMFALVSWIYQYRNADSEVIKIDDDGFAEVEIKPPEMPKPPPPEPKPPEPIKTEEPEPSKEKAPPQVSKPDKTPPPKQDAPKKPGVMDILNNIPKVNDTASSQNLTAALSNIKGVRVPGAAGVKVSALIGKAPSSGVQIGGAAGGLSTSGINSLFRKDGQAGALGGKGDHQIQGRVTKLTTQLRQKGQGSLSKEEIQKVINQHIGEIQYCYEKQLNKQPGLAGRVVLEWGVGTNGHVTVVKVAQSSLASAAATNCMMSRLKSWKFPQPRGGAVTIVFPFVFNTV